MRYIRKASERGHANLGWLNSHHSFSFGRYYDPEHMGISVLRVINDDRVAPGRGFETHGHKDMEILPYVKEGRLAHKDSTGNSDVIPAGDIQRMTAGRGIMHSEFNGSDKDEVHFLQIWVLPAQNALTPGYEQKTIQQSGALTPMVTPDGRAGTVKVHQDMTLSRLCLSENESISIATEKRMGYLHVIKGGISIDSQSFEAGDGLGVYQDDTLQIHAHDDTEALWFDLPQL